MMKRIFCFALAATLLMLCGCASKTKSEEKDKVYNILFIGNSYTYYNDMPTEIFQKIAENAGYQVRIETITKGAHTLEKFADPEDGFGVLVAEELEEQYAGQYDYVILQEQSFRPVGEPDAFYDAVRNLVERIKLVEAEPVLYATWGYKGGHEKLAETGLTNETMAWALARAYQTMAEELSISAAYVGLAFLDVRNNSLYELYDADCSHPSELGSCLAGLTLFCTVFQEHPAPELLSELVDTDCAELFCQAVERVVFEEPQIPKS